MDLLKRVYDETKYLVLISSEKDDAIYDRIRYLISLKSGIIYVISHNYVRIKVDSYDALPLEKTLTLRNGMLNKYWRKIFNKNQNHYYYNIFLEKCLYQLAKK